MIIVTERNAGNYRYTGLLQQVLRQGNRSLATRSVALRNVGKHVERAIGRPTGHPWDGLERLANDASTVFERGHHALDLRFRLSQRCHRAAHGERGRVRRRVALDVERCLNNPLRTEGETQAPSGHGVGLLERIHQDDGLRELPRQGRGARVFETTVEKSIVGLVRQHHDVALGRETDDASQILGLDDPAAGI